MTKLMLRLLKVIAVSVLPCLSAQPGGTLRQFKLVAPAAGWVQIDNHLLWTDNDGRQWTDVSPSLAQGQGISGVFFLDRLHGWCLVWAPGKDGSGRVTLHVAYTSDNGQNWNFAPVAAADNVIREGFGGPVEIWFTDPLTGWIEIQLAASSASSWGALLRTSDGGKTWRRLPDLPVYGFVGFLPGGFGWVVGGPLHDKLYLTRDGGFSWQQSSFAFPAEAGTAVETVFGRPSFSTASRGMLPVSIRFEGHMSLATYATEDSGASWRLIHIERNIPGCCFVVTSAIGDRILRAKHSPSGATIGDGSTDIPVVASAITGAKVVVSQLDYVDPSHGWVLIAGDDCVERTIPCSGSRELLATKDGGLTFTPIIAPEVTTILPKNKKRTAPARGLAPKSEAPPWGASLGLDRSRGLRPKIVPGPAPPESGLSREEFCLQQGMSASTLARYQTAGGQEGEGQWIGGSGCGGDGQSNF